MSVDPVKQRQWAREYYARNKEKCKARHSIWVLNNKAYMLEYQRNKKRERKLEAISYLGGVCKDCNIKHHQAVFEFHHLDPKTKDRDPSKVLGLSWKRIVEELDKCVLLCANCHRLRHHNEF